MANFLLFEAGGQSAYSFMRFLDNLFDISHDFPVFLGDDMRFNKTDTYFMSNLSANKSDLQKWEVLKFKKHYSNIKLISDSSYDSIYEPIVLPVDEFSRRKYFSTSYNKNIKLLFTDTALLEYHDKMLFSEFYNTKINFADLYDYTNDKLSFVVRKRESAGSKSVFYFTLDEVKQFFSQDSSLAHSYVITEFKQFINELVVDFTYVNEILTIYPRISLNMKNGGDREVYFIHKQDNLYKNSYKYILNFLEKTGCLHSNNILGNMQFGLDQDGETLHPIEVANRLSGASWLNLKRDVNILKDFYVNEDINIYSIYNF